MGTAEADEPEVDLLVKALLDPLRKCECGWVGHASDTVHPKHYPGAKLCPECHELTEGL